MSVEYEHEPDGLDTFSLDQIGQKTGAFGGAKMIKFNNGDFLTREGDVISPTDEFLCLGLKKVIQKFVGKKLCDTILVPDGGKANVKELNDNAPREEWGPNFSGEIVGPYKLVLVLRLMNIVTLDLFAFVTDTKGGGIAIGGLTDKTKIMRRALGSNVSPVLKLRTSTFKTTNWGLKKRPDFVARWVILNGAGALSSPTIVPALDKPQTTTAQTPADAHPSTPAAESVASPTTVPGINLSGVQLNLTPVEEPTLKQEIGDDIPFE
jgi:hypothetical protein